MVGKADKNFLRPSTGTVIARFDGRANKGLDFTGSKGDPVYASREGRVVYASGGLRGYGQLILVKHDAHYVTAYAHNSQLLVKEGQAVKRGQLIARMGSTDADRVKLHFELRRNGSAVDPMPYFASGQPSESAKAPAPPAAASGADKIATDASMEQPGGASLTHGIRNTRRNWSPADSSP